MSVMSAVFQAVVIFLKIFSQKDLTRGIKSINFASAIERRRVPVAEEDIDKIAIKTEAARHSVK